MNYIITAAIGYQAEKLTPLLRSLRKASQERVALIITANQFQEMRQLADQYKAELFVFSERHYSAPECDRYFAYREFLNEKPNIENGFLTDSRDVIFQGSPFSNDSGHLYLYTEPVNIGECQINSRWIRKYYGESFLFQTKDCPVLCSGTTLGSYSRLRKYVEAMCSEIDLQLNQEKTYSWGADQAIHNYLFYAGKLPEAEIREHGSSEVLTLHHEKKFLFNEKGFLLNYDGTEARVIHQYDRHQTFLPVFNKMINR